MIETMSLPVVVIAHMSLLAAVTPVVFGPFPTLIEAIEFIEGPLDGYPTQLREVYPTATLDAFLPFMEAE